ncbi:MAG: bifunctional diaminohydroxyphosphoribosylaminopyrimidine deaminase/5-amino-6-(5-phosphoribosylamino)uracil reductase RibD [Cellulomonadaceae bacterium]|nr:bifunctional diaminohydroxyphosphoribosylaminopyrimidine deaminase/5-amino-6-(5-phosphoribosylamino)uracil reductase RibD [Cellulomonadaceae bacterium]
MPSDEIASTQAITDAMHRALTLAARGPAWGPNPRVGCVLLSHHGTELGVGFHRGAGTPHAEVDALANARQRGHDTAGATAVVTLEPCNHTGRTPPCSEALLAAGISEVIYALDDPGPTSSGGGQRLHEAGVTVASGLLADEARDLVRPWYHAVTTGRPWVTLKVSTSLDGFIAATDGTSQWITGTESRAHSRSARENLDAIAVTTGTVLADDPDLTARHPDGTLTDHQPLRIVVGQRNIPDTARLHRLGGEVLHLRTHEVSEVLATLHQREARHIMVEGGPALSAAFLAADAVDEIEAYVAPVVLGSGRSAVGPYGVTTLGDASRWHLASAQRFGNDVLLRYRKKDG